MRFFWNAPQGPEPTGTTGYKGFFYHFLDMETGLRFRDVELSSVDTTILLMGVPVRRPILSIVTIRPSAKSASSRKALYERADWNFFRTDGRARDLDGLASRATG